MKKHAIWEGIINDRFMVKVSARIIQQNGDSVYHSVQAEVFFKTTGKWVTANDYQLRIIFSTAYLALYNATWQIRHTMEKATGT